MRYLVFLRGVPGSGKSTFVSENNLIPYTISSDKVRILLKPPVLSVTGRFMLSQKINPRIWGLIYSVIKCRMEDGEFTILDATNAGNADMSKYRKLVKTYRYKAFCVDFSDVPLEIAKERNMKRPAYEIVPEAVIDEIYSTISTQKVPSFVTVIKPHEFHEKLRYRIADFSHYRRIHHIGAINGNYTVLVKYLEDGLNDSDLYIFTGDYIDNTYTGSIGYCTGTNRVAENAEVINFLISIMYRDNVILLEGDHEKWFCKLAADEEQSKIPEFQDILYFLREKKQERVSKGSVLELYGRMEPCVCYNFHNKCVLVTHGGLSSLPENLIFVGAEQMINGVGGSEDASIVAASFNRNTNENTYQVHGHRNPENLPIENGSTFNLSHEAEKERTLRVLTLDGDGFHGQEIEK
jgi:predicted kinase